MKQNVTNFLILDDGVIPAYGWHVGRHVYSYIRMLSMYVYMYVRAVYVCMYVCMSHGACILYIYIYIYI